MASILSPLLWSRVYAAGVRRGKAGLFFYSGVTAVSVVRLLIARSLADDFAHSEHAERKQTGDAKADSSNA